MHTASRIFPTRLCCIAVACLAISVPAQQPAPSAGVTSASQLEPLVVDDGAHQGEVLLNLDLDSTGSVANATPSSGDRDLLAPAIANTKLFRHPNLCGATGLSERVVFLRGRDVKTVPPEYPLTARNARAWGSVRMVAAVNPDGSVADVTILSGHPLLQNSARASLLEWRFPPIDQQGSPVSFHAVVTINFALH